MRILVVFFLAFSRFCLLHAEDPPFVTTQTPLTLVSINDGEMVKIFGDDPSRKYVAKDSITVIRLGPNSPPEFETRYGSVDSTIIGAPYLAVTQDAKYAIVPHHAIRFPDLGVPEPEVPLENKVSIVDLTSAELTSRSLKLKGTPISACILPSRNEILIGGGEWMHLIRINNGQPELVQSSHMPIEVSAFDVTSEGAVIATGFEASSELKNMPLMQRPYSAHCLKLEGNVVRYIGPVQSEAGDVFFGAFAPRFAPDGKRAFVLNGFGWEGKGRLDDMVIIDTSKPSEFVVVGTVPHLGDGLESLAVHPNGQLAVVACLDGSLGYGSESSHLAVIDISGDESRLLYHVPIEHIPEGIEFTPEGDKLFVGCTSVNHIVVFRVEGSSLERQQAVLPTGHGPSLMGLARHK